jgi:three-Cys-motif partner protein
MSGGHYEWCLGEPLPQLGDHSVAKHEIFEQYVGIYIERLTRTPSQTMLNLTIVDGFCGGGLYRRGQAEAEGSPLRLLNSVKQADRALNAARAKGFAVRADFFFVDDKAEHIAFLRDVLIKRGYPHEPTAVSAGGRGIGYRDGNRRAQASSQAGYMG